MIKRAITNIPCANLSLPNRDIPPAVSSGGNVMQPSAALNPNDCDCDDLAMSIPLPVSPGSAEHVDPTLDAPPSVSNTAPGEPIICSPTDQSGAVAAILDPEDSPEPPSYELPPPRTPGPRVATSVSDLIMVRSAPSASPVGQGEVVAAAMDDDEPNSPCHDLPPPEALHACMAAAGDVNEVSPNSTNSLLNFFDVMEEDTRMQFFTRMGEKNIDILRYRDYDLRRNSLAERRANIQRFHCRHNRKFKGCKGKLKLRVADPDNLVETCEVLDYVHHNHDPYRMKSYGHINVTELSDIQAQGTAFNNVSDFSNPHAISLINTGELSDDFQASNLNDKVRSTPMPPPKCLKLSGGKGPSVEITSLCIDTSQKDVRGYTIRKAVQFQRRFEEIVKLRGDDSDDDGGGNNDGGDVAADDE